MTSGADNPAHDALARVLAPLPQASVALSGGVDSMTLAHVAGRVLGSRVTMLHAVSPAVPPEASARVRAHAAAQGWRLQVLDAGEFADPRYLANPVDRCFFCKSNLYGAIAARFPGIILSGTNTDDLGDYRPGLRAAAANAVRHPYVEAGIDKAGVRRLAGGLGLADIAELPASPCLSSRLQTGIAVTAERLTGVLAVEQALQARFGRGRTLRCRVLPDGVELQLDDTALAACDDMVRAELGREIAGLCREHGLGASVRIAAYRRGSAFIGAGRHG